MVGEQLGPLPDIRRALEEDLALPEVLGDISRDVALRAGATLRANPDLDSGAPPILSPASQRMGKMMDLGGLRRGKPTLEAPVA